MSKLNLIIAATAAVAAMSCFNAPASAATEYPWCAEYGGSNDGGGRNCGFVSREQCMLTVTGMGGTCEPNLFYLDQVAKERGLPRKRPRPE